MPPSIGRYIALFTLLGITTAPLAAEEGEHPLCPMIIHEERVQLEDAVLTAELARSRFAAHDKIYKLIQGLWDADAIERMIYLEAKYDHDSYRLALERADLALEEQRALIEQYELFCGGKSQGKIEAARRRYREAHCDGQAKAIEIAEVDLEFNRQMLDSVRSLFAGEVATKTDVILAELDVELEKQRLADAERRTELCRQELARPSDRQ